MMFKNGGLEDNDPNVDDVITFESLKKVAELIGSRVSRRGRHLRRRAARDDRRSQQRELEVPVDDSRDARITEDEFVVGERIEPGRTLFRLVDEAIVWVDAILPAENARRIAVDSVAQVVLGDTRLTGKVVQRAHRTSEGTRSALVRIEVPNVGDRLHGGDYVEVYLDAGEGKAADATTLAVPTEALVQLEGETVVFRQAADGTLAPVEVRTGAVIGDRTVVLEGVAVGDSVVVEGAYALKSQILKSQLGEGHAH